MDIHKVQNYKDPRDTHCSFVETVTLYLLAACLILTHDATPSLAWQRSLYTYKPKYIHTYTRNTYNPFNSTRLITSKYAANTFVVIIRSARCEDHSLARTPRIELICYSLFSPVVDFFFHDRERERESAILSLGTLM